MMLQPLVENAYVHGLSRINAGFIEVTAKEDQGQLKISVRNSGIGLIPAKTRDAGGTGIGLTNIEKRLRLHFGDKGLLTIHAAANDMVEATVKFPLIFPASHEIESRHDEVSLPRRVG
jgi:LytS/YehU family sensor histidine kinase